MGDGVTVPDHLPENGLAEPAFAIVGLGILAEDGRLGQTILHPNKHYEDGFSEGYRDDLTRKSLKANALQV